MEVVLANPKANASRAWLEEVKALKRKEAGLPPLEESNSLPLLSESSLLYWNGFNALNGQRQIVAGGEQPLAFHDIYAYVCFADFDVHEADIFVTAVLELDMIYMRVMREQRAKEEEKSKRRGR